MKPLKLPSHMKHFTFQGTSAPVFQFSSHSSWISACKWHNTSSFHLLSSSYDGKVMLWDLRTAVSYSAFSLFSYLLHAKQEATFVSLDSVLTNAFCMAVASGYHGYTQGKGMMLFIIY